MTSTKRPALSLSLPSVALAAIATLTPSLAYAQDFYAGKTVTIVVGNPAGSGYDAYGRLLARHMGKHLPGNPQMIVQNMPGAGSVRAADYTYNIAPPDGTSFALAMPGTFVEPLTSPPGQYRYDPTKFAYIGTMDSGTRVCITGINSKIKTIDDARKNKTVIAATAPTSSAFQYPKFMNVLAGTKFEIITGYQGPPDVMTAIERGEADGMCGFDISTFKTLRPDWLAKKQMNMLIQFGLQPNKELKEIGFPYHTDFIKGEEETKVVDLIIAQQVFQRPYMAPPATPPERLKLLREAFMKAMKDEALLAEAAKQGLDLNPRSGEEVEALVKQIYSTPKDIIAKMQKAIAPN